MKNILIFSCMAVMILIGAGCGERESEKEAEETISTEDPTLRLEIQKTLGAHFNHTATATQVIVTDLEENYARGTVRFTEDVKNVRLFLLKKEGENWSVAYDGNEEMVCENLTGFPERMIEDCVPAGITFGDLQAIQEAVAKKTTVSIERFVLGIKQHTPEHAMGSVVIQGQEDELNVYTVKGESGWEVVYLGASNIACKTAWERGFAERLIPHCVTQE